MGLAGWTLEAIFCFRKLGINTQLRLYILPWYPFGGTATVIHIEPQNDVLDSPNRPRLIDVIALAGCSYPIFFRKMNLYLTFIVLAYKLRLLTIPLF